MIDLSLNRPSLTARPILATSSPMRLRGLVIVLLLTICGGCQTVPKTGDVVLFSAGVAGDGPWFGQLRDGLKQGGIDRQIISIHWGAPPPMFMLNYSNASIHNKAEQQLAEAIQNARKNDPTRQIDLIGHSAGCGVVLGALKRLPPDLHIRTVILLAPSVSPEYDLHESIDHVQNAIHVFISDRDTVFLKWRTSNFGGYDNIKTPAAGHAGFDLDSLDAAHRAKVIEHPYQTEWKDLGNDGGHFGATAGRFAAKIIAPLLN